MYKGACRTFFRLWETRCLTTRSKVCRYRTSESSCSVNVTLMQNLFEFNSQTGMIQLNREWIGMIPEFKEILVRSKPVKGDADGRKKLHAQRVFTWIYLMTDFKSPLRDMEEHDRLAEALRCSDMEPADIDDRVKAALAVYDEYQDNCARSLRTLKAMRKSLNQLDNYFMTIDFNAKDKKGELIHSAKEYLSNLGSVKRAYESYEEFEERVHRELTKGESVRGAKALGGKEGKRTSWAEGRRPAVQATGFKDLAKAIFDEPGDEDLTLDDLMTETDED